jgi:DHA1 family bicyclomycin/chloramphenicol resistance-like MFS transporter
VRRHRLRPANPRGTRATYRALVKDVPFVALALVAGLMFATLFAYVSGSPFVLQGLYGLDEQRYAVVFGLNAVGLIVATQLNPVLLRWASPRQVLTWAVATAAVAAAGLVVATATGEGGLAGVLAPLAVVVAACGLAFPNTPALALSRHGEAAGTAAALLGAVQFALGGAAAPLVGVLGTASAVPMAAVMLTATGTALALLGFVVRRHDRVPR